ncbi:hypothetical protein NDU88_004505 [Pleurodeles waltl]|uniref:Uncharacterized protein n=1 Tax=Pleurodeles waltl TaxID=8319 RepID=A0AAV7LLJ1_PLEWA|nr:hypothetical protein NDU88_004505 [Pleurodeles waltl]
MEAGLASSLRWLRLLSGGSAGAGGGAASAGGRLQPVSCSLGNLPTAAAGAAAGGGPTVSGAGGGACGGATGGAGRGAGAGAASGGGRLQPFSCSFGQLPTGDAADDSSGGSGGAGGGPAGAAARGAIGRAGGSAGGHQGFTCILLRFSAPSSPWQMMLYPWLCGGMVWSFAGVGGTLAVLTGAPFEPLGVAGFTLDGNLVAGVLAWVLDTLARGE